MRYQKRSDSYLLIIFYYFYVLDFRWAAKVIYGNSAWSDDGCFKYLSD